MTDKPRGPEDPLGRTPLMRAILERDETAAARLVGEGGPVGKKDLRGMTALHFAVLVRSHALVTLLLGAGADVNARNVHGNTPLFDAIRAYAVSQRTEVADPQVIEALLAAAADAHLENKQGFSPYDFAHRIADTDVARFFPRTSAPREVPPPFEIPRGDRATELEDEIDHLVRAGFLTKKRLLELVCRDMYAPGEVDKDEVRALIAATVREVLAEQASWPDETDCDKLDEVFAALRKAHVIALQNAGYMHTEGYDEVIIAQHRRKAARTFGYCFYTMQDVIRAQRDGGLRLAFGPVDPNEEEARGAEVGRAVVAALAAKGFVASWNGTYQQRIHVPAFTWRRRIADE